MKEVLQRWRFRLLLLSIGCIFVSPLFFVIQNDVRTVLLLGGMLAALALLIINLVSGLRTALAALVAVAAGALVCWASESALTQASFHLFIWNHEEELNHAVRILERSEVQGRFYARDTCVPAMNLSDQDCRTLRELLRETGAGAFTWDGSTYFELFGRLDVRWGILYCPEGTACQGIDREHLEGPWYRWW